MFQSLFFVGIGLAVLLAGAELLVRGAAALAARLGITPLVIGLTVVAFGTSAPELAVSTKAAFDGAGGLAVGNAVGSNTFNILVILGLSALVTPLAVDVKLVRVDVPVMIVCAFVLWLMAVDGEIGRLDGALLTGGIVVYTIALFRFGPQQQPDHWDGQMPSASSAATAPSNRSGMLWQGMLILAGLALCVLGSRWLVSGATDVAGRLGVSDLIIGLTIVAAGTSLPELATSIVAAIRGQRDIAVGNVVGSNIFNVLGVLGISSLVAPRAVDVPNAAITFDMPVMVAVSVACLPVFFTGSRVSRPEGGLFLFVYGAYLIYLIMAAIRHEAIESYSAAMVWFVLPMVALGIGASVMASLRLTRGTRRHH